MGEGKTVGPGKIWKIGCEGGHEEPKLPENMGALREGAQAEPAVGERKGE